MPLNKIYANLSDRVVVMEFDPLISGIILRRIGMKELSYGYEG